MIIDGRPAEIVYKYRPVIDDDGFEKRSKFKIPIAYFQDNEGGEKILHGDPKTGEDNGKGKTKHKDNGKGKTNHKDSGKGKTKNMSKDNNSDEVDNVHVPGSTDLSTDTPVSEPCAPTGWAALAAKPADEKAVAEANDRLSRAHAEYKIKRSAEKHILAVGKEMRLDDSQILVLVQTIRQDGIADLDLNDDEMVAEWIDMVLVLSRCNVVDDGMDKV